MKQPRGGELYEFKREIREKFIGDGWCRHGMLTIQTAKSELKGEYFIGVDTYWGDKSDRMTSNWWPWDEIAGHVDFVLDLNKAKEVHRELFETFEDKDRAWIPQGGRSERFYVLKTAKPSVALQIEQIKISIRHSKERIQTETWNIERKEKELIDLSIENPAPGPSGAGG